MPTIEDDYQRLNDKLNHTKRELSKLSPVQMLWIAPHIDALYDDIEHLRNQHIIELYNSCGKQDVKTGEEMNANQAL